MRVGFLQFSPKFKERGENLKRIEELIKDAEADLLVLPELSTTGYSFNSREEIIPFAEEIPGYTSNRILKIASYKKMLIVYGFIEKEGDRLYNSSLLVSPEGIVGKYRKLHLFYKEKLIFTPGDLPLKVFDIKGVKVGLLICFDWIFPEALRTLALKGAQIVCHSANLILPYCQDAMRTRAIENRVFIITANRTGEEGEYRFTGRSQIVNPKGEIILTTDDKEEVVKVLDIDPAQALDKKVNEYNDLFKDRREGFYFR